MALEDMKIKEKDFIGKDVSSLPVHPSADGMGAVELQAAFDRAVKEVIVPKFNALLEEMPHLTKLLASTELTSEDFLHYANDTNTGFTISALLELSRQHRASMENPHAVTKEQIGLGKVDNTADKDKPASDAVKNEIKVTSDGLQAQINGINEDLRNKASLIESHQSDINNPHKVTKEQVGLGNVDNTADKDKPVSDATVTMLSEHVKDANKILKKLIEDVNQVLENWKDTYWKPLDEQTKQNRTAIDEHKGKTDNPHKVTKEQIGLGSVDNTSDLNKPVSTAVQAALDNLYETKVKPIEAGGALGPRVSSLEEQVTDNKNACDRDLASIDSRLVNNENQTNAILDSLTQSIDAHKYRTDNPHKVTAEQVGLGNISNRVDALERQLPRVMTRAAFDALTEKDASVVYILT